MISLSSTKNQFNLLPMKTFFKLDIPNPFLAIFFNLNLNSLQQGPQQTIDKNGDIYGD
jgi:hypothetical protein